MGPDLHDSHKSKTGELIRKRVSGGNVLNKISLRSRILFVVAVALALCAAVAVAGFSYFNRRELEEGMINKQRTIHTQLAAATEFVARQGGLEGVIQKFSGKYKSAESLTDSERGEILNQVPIYAAMSIGRKNAQVDKYEFRVFSDEPRRKENLANAAEMEVFRKFAANPELKEQIYNNGHIITVYRPVRLSHAQGCQNCHGDPATSPWKNGTDILGYRMENWPDGKLHGVFAITQKGDEVVAASMEGKLISPATWLIGAIFLGAFIALVFGAFMVRGPLDALARAAGLLDEASGKVGLTSEQIAKSSQSLSQATTEQAASLEETAASIEEVSSMVTKNSENARNTAATSSDSRGKAERGKEVVERMIQSMGEIDRSNQKVIEQITHSNAEMGEIVKVIQQIADKTKVINDIVFQTKLLSFNASVEAARAGEHGKGFAVVAEEVGNLAQMSGNAAKEISSMLQDSVRKVESIAAATKDKVERLVADGSQKVAAGAEVAKECGAVLNEIVSDVAKVSQMAGEISNSSNEQAQGVQELNKAVNQLDQVTQQNASASEQSARTAEDLAGQANAMREAVNTLLATIQGAREESLPGRRAVPAPDGLAEVRQIRPARKREAKARPILLAAGGHTPDPDHPGFEEV